LPVAQRIEHLTTDQKVWGSNPYGCAIFLKSAHTRHKSMNLDIVVLRFFINHIRRENIDRLHRFELGLEAIKTLRFRPAAVQILDALILQRTAGRDGLVIGKASDGAIGQIGEQVRGMVGRLVPY
jgi:hypothetical protein